MSSTTSSRPKTRTLLSILVIWFFIASTIGHVPETTSIATETTENSEAPRQIAAGATISHDLPAAHTDVFSISVEQGKLLRFSIDKGDLVLSTRLYDPAGGELLEHVSQDFEVVELSYPIQLAGTYRIELKSLERAAVRGNYQLRVHDLKIATALDRKDSEARQVIARAEVWRANWTKASFEQAAAEFDKAASIWTAVSDFSSASHAALKSGDIYFLFGDYAEARKHYQHAETLAAGEWLPKARALSRMGRLQSFLGNNGLAQKQITQALDLFKQHDTNRNAIATNAYGEVLSNLAEVTYAKGDLLKSSKQFEAARQVFQNDRKGIANIHLFNAYIAGSRGEPEEALAQTSSALELSRAINNKTGEGLALSALGLDRSSKRDENGAMALHRQAIKIFSVTGDRHSEAIALNALGQVYENLTDYSTALSFYNDASRLFQNIGSLDGVTVATFKIAKAYLRKKELDQALTYFDRCLSLSRAAGKLRTEANALNEIANVYAAQGRHELALKQYQKIEAFYQAIGDRRGQIAAFNAHGDLLLQLEQKQRALDLYSRALPLSEKAGDNGLRLTTLYNLARADFELGSPDVALRWIKESLKIIEDLRTNLASPEFRISYFSGARKHYELCIAILMQLDRARPGEGLAAEALWVSEKSRARLLLDFIPGSRVALSHGATAELLKREREVRGSIRLLGPYELDLSLSKNNSSQLAEVTKQLAGLRSEYQEIQAQLRQHRLLTPLERFEPVGLKQIQNELRDTDTLLLQYSLGERQSYLWAVTANSFWSFELPPRKYIEDVATEVSKLLTARQDTERQSNQEYQAKVDVSDRLYFEKAAHLSQVLLGPIAPQLGNRRVLLVAEGMLQYIPFDALPAPGEPVVDPNASGGRQGRLLIETNEIDGTPSFSALVAIRGEKNYSPSTNRVVAVIADPVFGLDDDRVQGDGPTSPIASAASNQPEHTSVAQVLRDPGSNNGLPRLLHSSEEADAISAAAPRGTTMIAKGFDATRETAMSPQIGEYQIVHFATHGLLNSEQPELSGIVLTRVDRAGAKRDGVILLHDVYSLDLSAELTVLSACQTALGKDVRGEGLVGLTHGFMSAGSKTVVASLWKVDDRATASLMADFYHSMLQKGMPTGAALRAAKLKTMQDKRWHAPYFWAGFVLQGEHTNHIAVERSSLFSTRTVLLLLLLLVLSGLIFFHWRRRRLSRARRV